MEQEVMNKVEILEQGFSTIIVGAVSEEKPKKVKKEKDPNSGSVVETKASKKCELPLHKPSELPTLCMKAGLISGEVFTLGSVQKYILENNNNPFGDFEIILKDLSDAGYELKYPSNFEKELGLGESKIINGLLDLYSYLLKRRNEYENAFKLRIQHQVISSRGEKKQHLLIDKMIKIIELIPGLPI